MENKTVEFVEKNIRRYTKDLNKALRVLNVLKEQQVPLFTAEGLRKAVDMEEGVGLYMTAIQSISCDENELVVVLGREEVREKVAGEIFWITFNGDNFYFSFGDVSLCAISVTEDVERAILTGRKAGERRDMRSIVADIMESMADPEETFEEYLGSMTGSGELLSRDYGEILEAAINEPIDFDEVHEILGPIVTALLHTCTDYDGIHREILNDLLRDLKKAHSRLYHWHEDHNVEKQTVFPLE